MLYVCATPIGNLRDITLRALEILEHSDIILCEDTRNSRHLLSAHNISYKKLIAYHAHNEAEMTPQVLAWLQEGLLITQISDAGTPSISDPGARLCKEVLQRGLAISPLPGACAMTALLSVAGLNCAYLFHGFLASSSTARCEQLKKWREVDYAVCIYEAPHRIIALLTDIVNVLGNTRQIIMGRELTKQFETIKRMQASQLLAFITHDLNQQRGEFVLLITPHVVLDDAAITQQLSTQQIDTLELLLPELPPKKAVQITHKLVGGDKTLLYNHACQNR